MGGRVAKALMGGERSKKSCPARALCANAPPMSYPIQSNSNSDSNFNPVQSNPKFVNNINVTATSASHDNLRNGAIKIVNGAGKIIWGLCINKKMPIPPNYHSSGPVNSPTWPFNQTFRCTHSSHVTQGQMMQQHRRLRYCTLPSPTPSHPLHTSTVQKLSGELV